MRAYALDGRPLRAACITLRAAGQLWRAACARTPSDRGGGGPLRAACVLAGTNHADRSRLKVSKRTLVYAVRLLGTPAGRRRRLDAGRFRAVSPSTACCLIRTCSACRAAAMGRCARCKRDRPLARCSAQNRIHSVGGQGRLPTKRTNKSRGRSCLTSGVSIAAVCGSNLDNTAKRSWRSTVVV